MRTFEMAIQSDFATGEIGLYIAERRDGELYIAQPIELVFEHVPRGQQSKGPTISVNHFDSKEFFGAMQKVMSEKGIETESESMAKGKLEATVHHLEDMRTLLKLKKRG
jgi:hypothetical protein